MVGLRLFAARTTRAWRAHDFALVVREPTLIIGGLERTDLEVTGVMDVLVR